MVSLEHSNTGRRRVHLCKAVEESKKRVTHWVAGTAGVGEGEATEKLLWEVAESLAALDFKEQSKLPKAKPVGV